MTWRIPPIALALTLAAGPIGGSPSRFPQPSPCSEAGYRQFDFWVGDWDVLGPDGARAGTNSIRKILGGCALQENWRGASGSIGTSLNTYTPATGEWHQTWVDDDGLLLRLDGRFDGVMALAGETAGPTGARTHHRLTFTPLADDRVRQLWESSSDDRRSWQIVFDGTYVRRRGPASW